MELQFAHEVLKPTADSGRRPTKVLLAALAALCLHSSRDEKSEPSCFHRAVRTLGCVGREHADPALDRACKVQGAHGSSLLFDIVGWCHV